MLYPNREMNIEGPFEEALTGKFTARVAGGEAHTLVQLARLTYDVGSRRHDETTPQPDYAPPRVNYWGRLHFPWMAGVELCIGGYEQANYQKRQIDFSPDVVRLRLGDKQLSVTKDYDAFAYDSAAAPVPGLRLEGIPRTWDQGIHVLPLDEENLPLVRKVVADAALMFLDDFEW